MFDWTRIKDPSVREKIKKKAADFMRRCHFGTQGIAKTPCDAIEAAKRLLDSGFRAIAFDSEMTLIPYVKDMLKGHTPLHVPVAYPMGRTTLQKKMNDLERLYKMGVEDVCVCLDWQAIFSRRFQDIETEARTIMRDYGTCFLKNALVLPATLMSDTDIIDTCTALDQAGVISVKINPGCRLGVSFEEVQLINRVFPLRFDIHPSGNIRDLNSAERYMELGCNVIHSASSLDITKELIIRESRKYGEEV
jgi:deoxyribose-phosphate aldolase